MSPIARHANSERPVKARLFGHVEKNQSFVDETKPTLHTLALLGLRFSRSPRLEPASRTEPVGRRHLLRAIGVYPAPRSTKSCELTPHKIMLESCVYVSLSLKTPRWPKIGQLVRVRHLLLKRNAKLIQKLATSPCQAYAVCTTGVLVRTRYRFYPVLPTLPPSITR